MFAVTGITGKVGAAVARRLLAEGREVRAVLRNPEKASEWVAQGCDVALAEMTDPIGLTHAFRDAEGVFVLIPPVFDPTSGFPEVRRVIASLVAAIKLAKPGRIVCLSTIGAQATQANLLNQLGLVEAALGTLDLPIAFLRAAWFMENSAAAVRVAMTAGVIRSHLQPLDRPVAMVATADIGRVAAELLCETWQGRRITELEGPQRVSPTEIATELSGILDRQVRIEAAPRVDWEAEFLAEGARNPLPRMQMIDGFNEGWIEFEEGEAGSRKGLTPIGAVLRDLVALS